jgi:hypothetical protein
MGELFLKWKIYTETMVSVLVLNATFNNISSISRRSALLVMETGEAGENHRPVASHLKTHNVV